MRIREAEIGDAVAIAEVIHSVKEIRSVASQSLDAIAEIVEANLRRIDASHTSTAFVVEDASGVVLAYCVVHWVPFLFLAGGEAYLTELFVRPSATGQKVGTGLLERVILDAKKRGCARLSLLNGRDGASYQRGFYKKLGWVERDRMANFVLTLSGKSSPATLT